MFSVYYLYDDASNKRYVGQTKDSIIERMKRHVYDAKIFRNNKNKCDWINSNRKKVKVALIEKFDTIKETDNSERYWIKQFKLEGFDVMNITSGGQTGNNWSQTPESLLKMSKNRKGKCVGKEHHMYGKHHSAKSKMKISKTKTGVKHNEEFKKKCRERCGDNSNNKKLTEQKVREIKEKYTPYIYTSTMLAKEYDVSQPTIKDILKNKIWKIVNVKIKRRGQTC